jgi:hypothetical protein
MPNESNPSNDPSLDILIENHGSILLLRPTSSSGLDWLEANIQPDAVTFGDAVVCEPRYVSDIVRGARADGLAVARWQF